MDAEQNISMMRNELDMLASRVAELENINQSQQADDAVRIAHVVPGAGVDVKQMGESVILSVPDIHNHDKESFSHILVGNSLTVRKGYFRILGIASYLAAQTTLTLSADVEYIYVKHLSDHSATTIEQLATEPSIITPDAYNRLLYVFTAVVAGVYDLTWDYRYDVFSAAIVR